MLMSFAFPLGKYAEITALRLRLRLRADEDPWAHWNEDQGGLLSGTETDAPLSQNAFAQKLRRGSRFQAGDSRMAGVGGRRRREMEDSVGPFDEIVEDHGRKLRKVGFEVCFLTVAVYVSVVCLVS